MSATRPPKFAGPTFRQRKPDSVTESREVGTDDVAGVGAWARTTFNELETTIARAARARTGMRGIAVG
jgi:hypothetical protein